MYEKNIMVESRRIINTARLIGEYVKNGDRTTYTGETIKASERVCILMGRLFSEALLRDEFKCMQNRHYIAEHTGFNPFMLLGGDI